MTKKVDSKGDALNGNRRSPLTPANSPDVYAPPNNNLLMALVAEPDSLARAMTFFADHDGGCLKVRRSLDSADLHLTWTWSAGLHAGTYVYVRVEYWRLLFGLELLERKVLSVEGLYTKGTPDKMASRP